MNPRVHEIVKSHAQFHFAFDKRIAIFSTFSHNFALGVIQREAIRTLGRFHESRAGNGRVSNLAR